MIERELNMPFENDQQNITTGTFMKDMNSLKFNEPLVFYVFRVVVGRAYVMTASQLQKEESERVNLKDKLAGGKYHSIYITEEQK